MKMKNISRRITLVSVAAMLLSMMAVFAGCTDSATKNTATGVYGGVDVAKLENTDLTFVSHFDPGSKSEKNSFGKAVKWWKEKTGGKIDINIISADIYPTKLMAMIGAGKPADLIMVDQRGWMPRLAVLNVIQPVDDFVNKDEMLDKEKRLYDSLTWKGKHYAAYINGAWGYSLWYNKTMFQNNGVKTPREYWEEGNWTWDTFLETAKELTMDTDKDGKTDKWGFSYWGCEIFPASNNGMMTKTNEDGTVDVIWNNKEFVNAAQFAADLINKYKVWPADMSYHVNNFKAGNVAMSAGANDFVMQFCKDMNDEVDNAPFPIGPDMDPNDIKYIGYSLFFGIGKGAKNVDGARAFLGKLREFEKEYEESGEIDPDSNYAYLTEEQIETCEYMDSKVVLNYESGFGNWETDRWLFWTDILFQGVPVSTALTKHKPVLEKNIKDTLDAQFVEIKPFKPVPIETFESADLSKFILTQKDLPELSAGVKVSVASGGDALDKTSSLKIDYPQSDDWAIMLRTDETKIELPSYHRFIIKFDYKLTSDKPVNLYLTIRPKATLNEDTVSYGFVKITAEPGKAAKFEGHIDVLDFSKDNVLLMIGESNAATLIIDNFEIIEG